MRMLPGWTIDRAHVSAPTRSCKVISPSPMCYKSPRTLRWSRTAAEVIALLRPSPFPEFESPLLQAFERGDGHPVLVLPASFRSDRQTAKLRAFLAGLGYGAHGWELGVNLGPIASIIRRAAERVADLFARHGTVSLVGFSMGGLFARLLAIRYPARVRQVITVCSPVHGPEHSVWIPLDPLLGLWPGADLRALLVELDVPPVVPSTCIYSRDDGIVRWTHCRDARISPQDNIEVRGCHMTMPHNPEVWRILATRLAPRAREQ
jgi:alpha/beta hydrolase fold